MCDRDCFNCKYKDCRQNDVTYVEYREIENRNREEKFDSDKYKWNKAHPDCIAKAKKKYREAHLEEERRKGRERYHAKRDYILERNKTDYMRDYKREWMRKKRRELKEQAE